MWHLCSLFLLASGMAACDSAPPDQPAQAGAEPLSMAPAPQAKPRVTPPAMARPVAASVDYDRYEDLRFGMSAAGVRAAWDGALRAAPDDEQPVFYLSPAVDAVPAGFALMIEHDKFVRYSVGSGNQDDTAPGGGRIGMTVGQIEKLHPGRVAKRPHAYVDGGQYLGVPGDDGSDGMLVFEADASGRISQWRLGQPPQVDHVGGYS